MNNNIILITIIGVLVGGSAIYVGYKTMRPGINSGRISSSDLLNDLDMSRHSRRSSFSVGGKRKSRRK